MVQLLDSKDGVLRESRLTPDRINSEAPKPGTDEYRDRRLSESLQSLRVSFATAIASELESLPSVQSMPGLEQCIEAYGRQFSRYRSLVAEWTKFLESLVRIEVSSVGSDEVQERIDEQVREWKAQLLGRFSSFTPENLVSAKLAALPLDQARSRLHLQLQELRENFAQSMVEQLAALVERRILGKIEWFSDDTCKISGVKRRLEFEFTRPITKRSLELEEGQWYRHKRLTTREKKQGFCDEKIHHLISASASNFSEAKVLLPEPTKSLVKETPSWIAPSLSVVSGTLIREIAVTQDLGVTESEVVLKDEVKIHHDPALTQGPVVLDVWKECDVREEQRARMAAAKRAARNGRWPWNKTAGFVALGFANLAMANSVESIWTLFAATLLATMSIALLSCRLEKQRAFDEAFEDSNANADWIAKLAAALVFAAMVSHASLHSEVVSFILICFVATAFLFLKYLSATRHWNVAALASGEGN